MIDFEKASVFRLKQMPVDNVKASITSLLLEGEEIVAAFSSLRDTVTFTNKRIIACNVQGITGAKKDFTSLPFSKVQAFSVETAGTFDLDAELDIWFSGLGRVNFEFKANTDVAALSRMIAQFVL